MGKTLLPGTQVRNMIERVVRSGALPDSAMGEWKARIEDEEHVAEQRRLAEAGDVSARAHATRPHIYRAHSTHNTHITHGRLHWTALSAQHYPRKPSSPRAGHSQCAARWIFVKCPTLVFTPTVLQVSAICRLSKWLRTGQKGLKKDDHVSALTRLESPRRVESRAEPS